MIDKLYLQSTHSKIMPYNDTTVVIGGLMHIPVIILLLRILENRLNKNAVEYKSN